MFKATTILTLSIAFFLSSCSNNQEQAAEADDQSNEVVNESEALLPVEELSSESQIEEVPATEQSINMSPAAAPATGVRLNPAHGEPGHRCDVNVGDPLPDDNGTPGGVTVQQPAQQPVQQPIQQSAPTPTQAPSSIMNTPPTGGVTAEGMNPPHGEPGHDCAIPVGAPLKK